MAGALAGKLQIKPGQRLLILNAPSDYAERLGPLPEGVTVATEPSGEAGAVHLFVTDRADLARLAGVALGVLAPGGLLWIAYPKGGARAGTDLNRDILREVVEAAHGWTAVALVAVDDVWSAMRFRPVDRAGTPSRTGC